MSNSPKKSLGNSRRMETAKKSSSAKKAKHSTNEAGNQGGEEMDLSKAMFPLRHYLSNRSEFVHQLFQSVSRENTLQLILPDILRDIPQAELKKLCVQQLEVMSKKRVGRILDGKEMESSSETEDSDGETKPARKAKGIAAKLEVKETETQVADSTSSDLAESTIEVVTSSVKTEDDMLELHADSADDVMLGIVESHTTHEAAQVVALQEQDSLVPPPPPPPPPAVPEEAMPLLASSSITKTCMEIMELELRARAIKSLLKTQANKNIP